MQTKPGGSAWRWRRRWLRWWPQRQRSREPLTPQVRARAERERSRAACPTPSPRGSSSSPERSNQGFAPEHSVLVPYTVHQQSDGAPRPLLFHPLSEGEAELGPPPHTPFRSTEEQLDMADHNKTNSLASCSNAVINLKGQGQKDHSVARRQQASGYHGNQADVEWKELMSRQQMVGSRSSLQLLLPACLTLPSLAASNAADNSCCRKAITLQMGLALQLRVRLDSERSEGLRHPNVASQTSEALWSKADLRVQDGHWKDFGDVRGPGFSSSSSIQLLQPLVSPTSKCLPQGPVEAEGGEEALYWCSGLACLALARSKQLSGLDAEWS
ncbi:hypothetical protein MC885_018128 [Smutsia gigantea]|nr:hypothetical protein MC885_018128 [Smutsia gigantea]